MNILAFRNLLRGWRFGLPAGSAVAKKFCLDPIDIEPDHDAVEGLSIGVAVVMMAVYALGVLYSFTSGQVSSSKR